MSLEKLNFHLLEKVITSVNDGLMLKDVNSRVAISNEWTAKLVGFKNLDGIIGITDYDVKCPAVEFADVFTAHDREVVATKKPLSIVELQQYQNDIWRAGFVKKSYYTDDESGFKGVLCQSTEITNMQLIRFFAALANKNKPFTDKLKAFSYTLSQDNYHPELTQRQAECLFYFLCGKTEKEIAKILSLSFRTVSDHFDRIKRAFNCHTRSQLYEKAYALNLFHVIPISLMVK